MSVPNHRLLYNTVAARTGTGECMGKKKRVRDEGSEDDAFYGEEPLPNMSKKPGAPHNEAQGKRNTELPPELHDCVKAALLGHFGHEGAAGAGGLQALHERVAPDRIADALFEQRCSDLELSSSQMAEHLNVCHSVTFANQLDRTVLQKEIIVAFETMPARFRFADRTGRLSVTDRQSLLARYFLSAEQTHDEEVRKLYREKLHKVWTEHFCAASGI